MNMSWAESWSSAKETHNYFTMEEDELLTIMTHGKHNKLALIKKQHCTKLGTC